MYSKEELVREIKRVAQKLGKKGLNQKDFELNSMIPLSTIRYFFSTWPAALSEAGLKSLAEDTRVDDEQLLQDLIRLFDQTGELPSYALVKEKGNYSGELYKQRWNSLSEAFLLAQKKYGKNREPEIKEEVVTEPVEPEPPVAQQAGNEPVSDQEDEANQAADLEIEHLDLGKEIEDQKIVPAGSDADLQDKSDEDEIQLDDEAQDQGENLNFSDLSLDKLSVEPEGNSSEEVIIPDTIKPKKKKRKSNTAGEFINFKGLKFAPMDKLGVIYLFGKISHKLGYIVEIFKQDYPVCEARRCLDMATNQWEQVRLEFAFKTSEFAARGLRESKCDILVCWDHDSEDTSLEVLELSSVLPMLKNR